MEEPQSFGALLGEVLARDRALLGRKEELLAVLEGRVSGVQVWAYRSLARAVRETNVAEAMLAADTQDAAGRAQAAGDAAETLRALGMQDRAVHRVVDAIVEALGWQARAEREVAAAEQQDTAATARAVAATVEVVAAEDGAETGGGASPTGENAVEDAILVPTAQDAGATGTSQHTAGNPNVDAAFQRFLGATSGKQTPQGTIPPDAASPATTDAVLVGKPYSALFARPAEPASADWTCRCGHAGNHGKFCVICGLPRADGAVAAADLWTCICGRAKNTGKFCVACGRSRADGDSRTHASLVWACACGRRGNKGNFCTACGRPRAESEVELWTCTCGHEGNAGRFCTACGRSRAEGERR